VTDQPAEVSAADRAVAVEVFAFLRGIDWSASSETWKQDRLAEVISRYMAAERERAQRLESCLRELLDNGAFPTAAEDRARAALEKKG